MGQYYKVAFSYNDGEQNTQYSSREVGGCDEFIGGKLLEHSYFGNILMDSIAGILENNITKLAWIGDYAEGTEVENITHGEVCYSKLYSDKYDVVLNPTKDFVYKSKFLFNVSKNEYISFDEYLSKADRDSITNPKNWVMNPISILTTIGNGRGNGDFIVEDSNIMKYVGSWAWDYITIVNHQPTNAKKLDVVFELNY